MTDDEARHAQLVSRNKRLGCRQPTFFTGKLDDWDSWSYRFVTYCAQADYRFETLMDIASTRQREPLDTEWIDDWDLNYPGPPDWVTAQQLSIYLFAELTEICRGDAATVVRLNRTTKNGFETWRQLCNKYGMVTRSQKLLQKAQILATIFHESTFINQLGQREALIKEHEDISGPMDDDFKIAHLLNNTI